MNLYIEDATTNPMILTVSPGSHLSRCIADAIGFLNGQAHILTDYKHNGGEPYMGLMPDAVTFKFNDIPLVITEDSTVRDVEAIYNAALDARSAAYWTPERKAAQEAKEAADQAALAAHIASLNDLDLNDLDDSIRWLRKHETLSFTHTKQDRQAILAHFADANLGPGVRLKREGETHEEWAERVGVSGQKTWLIGQALDSIATVGRPIPMIHSFATALGVSP